MFRRNILNILLVLIFSFVISCSNKSRYQFSRKYSPIYNPDGEAFDSNVEFARDYSIYKEHRDALTSGVDKNSKSVNTRRKVKPKAQVKDKEYEAFLKEEGHDSMIDSNGINLIDVAGAKFIDPMEDDNGVDVQDVKDKNEVPVAKAADKTKLQDVKNEPPVAKAADKTKLQDVKNEPPVAKAADKTKLQDVKNEPPVAKAEDKTKLQDVKNEPPVAKAADKTKLQDVKNEPPVAKAADKTKLQDVKNE
ncbi:TRP75-related protein, partial [Ehrlichia muris]